MSRSCLELVTRGRDRDDLSLPSKPSGIVRVALRDKWRETTACSDSSAGQSPFLLAILDRMRETVPPPPLVSLLTTMDDAADTATRLMARVTRLRKPSSGSDSNTCKGKGLTVRPVMRKEYSSLPLTEWPLYLIHHPVNAAIGRSVPPLPLLVLPLDEQGHLLGYRWHPLGIGIERHEYRDDEYGEEGPEDEDEQKRGQGVEEVGQEALCCIHAVQVDGGILWVGGSCGKVEVDARMQMAGRSALPRLRKK